jgi:hypothetical protein
MMPHMTDAGLAQWRAQQAQQQGGFRTSSSQNPMMAVPFPPAEITPPKQLRPWVAVAMGVGIGLLALLAIIAAISFSQKSPTEPESPAPKSTVH